MANLQDHINPLISQEMFLLWRRCQWPSQRRLNCMAFSPTISNLLDKFK